jgi:hypothetical protein
MRIARGISCRVDVCMGVQLCVLGGSACGTIGIADGLLQGCGVVAGVVMGCGVVGVPAMNGVVYGQAISVLAVWMLCGGDCGAAFLFQVYIVD